MNVIFLLSFDKVLHDNLAAIEGPSIESVNSASEKIQTIIDEVSCLLI